MTTVDIQLRIAAGRHGGRNAILGDVKWLPEKKAFDEAFDRNGTARQHYRPLVSILESFTQGEIERRERLQKLSLMDQGITFTVYGEKEGTERIFPFDFVPRVIPSREWERLQAGLVQRVTALNLFILDVYQGQKCLKDRIIPPEIVLSRKEYKRELLNVIPPRQIFTHVVGTDIIRNGSRRVPRARGQLPLPVGRVLRARESQHPESRLSGVLQVLSGPADQGLSRPCCSTRCSTRRRGSARSRSWSSCTPGMANSAYFEHSFLAREMGVVLVEGRDLIVEDNYVFMRTTQGKQKVDVIYRRVDDDFIDPLTFRRDSLLGVPGLMNVYREGNVGLANAPGAGVADDKSVYAFMPELIRYYLGEDALLAQVPTYLGARAPDLAYIQDHAHELVIKTTGDSGGYGMLMGPFAAKKEIETYVGQVKKNPGNYIAQPLVELSAHPTYVDGKFEARRIDLRPFILYGDSVRVLPGGLTRVALRPGSYVVNSSQGGGSKDTWVLAEKSA